MTSNLGLPPYVMTFLRHMDSYKDFLKWNIGESSHKVTLTLSWNFQKDKEAATLRQNLVDKLHKTLTINQTMSRESQLPPDVTTLISNVPQKHRRRRLKQRITTTLGAIRNTLSLSQSSLDRADVVPYPVTNHSNHISRAGKPPLMRNNSFHGCVSHSTPRSMSIAYSPTRSTECSWPAGSSEAGTSYSADELDYVGSGDLLCFPASFVYAAQRSPSQSRAILAYRSTPDIDQVLPDDFMDNTCADVQLRSRPMRRAEMEKRVVDWSKIVTGRCQRPNYFQRSLTGNTVAVSSTGRNSMAAPPPPVLPTNSIVLPLMSSDSLPLPPPPSAASNNSCQSSVVGFTSRLPPQLTSINPSQTMTPLDFTSSPVKKNGTQEGNSKGSLGTVSRCLDSCDKILNRYETEIT